MSSKIKTRKGDICPICKKQIKSKNRWVKYHIRYSPPIVILACKYCNYIEYALRNDLDLPRCGTPTRIYMLKSYMYKFNIIL